MAQIQLFGLGVVSRSPFVTAKQLVNLYAEKRPRGEAAALVAYGTPGKLLFHDFGDTPCRGGLEFPQGNVAYVVHRAVLWEINNAGIATNRGTLNTTTGRVSMDHNGVQVMIVDGTDGYIYNTVSQVFAQITDADFPANPVTCCVLSRRFIANFLDSSRFYVSDIDNGLSWDALMFANAESNADPILAVWASTGQLILLGQMTTEFWGNSGALDFPFTALQGTSNEWGIGAIWSIAKYDNSFALVIKNRMGQVMIAQMGGYLPKKISTPDVDSIINGYPSISNASAYSYMLGGHPMYVINFPSANDGDGASWLYDGSTSMWSVLKSHLLERDRAEFGFSLIGKQIVADYATGTLYRLDETTYSENGASITREITGETVAIADAALFPVDCLRLEMETGIGLTSGQGVNPQVALSLSRDNGKTWGPDMWRTAGAIGEYGTRVEWRRLGTVRSIVPRIRMTDPVKPVFVAACINPPT